MTETLNHETFDLIAVLAGSEHPTLEVPIYFNEALGFEIFQLEKERSTEFDEKKVAVLDKKLKALIKKAEKERYTVTVQAIPKRVREDIIKEVLETYPLKKDAFGREEENPEASTEFTLRLWQAHVVKITDPSGAIANLDETAIRALSGTSEAISKAINTAISEVQNGSEAGFEIASKDVDFLSAA